MASKLSLVSEFYNLLLSLDEPEMERVSIEEAENTLGRQLKKSTRLMLSHCLNVFYLN